MRRIAFIALVLAAVPQLARAQKVDIKEWTVPWADSRPRDPFMDAKGRVWFVGQVGNYVAYLDPANGHFEQYEIDDGVHPHSLIVDKAGVVWYTGNANGTIGRIDPDSRVVKSYAIPSSEARDPHTFSFGKDGSLWFTVQAGNYVGRLTPATGKMDLIAAPNGSRPYGIVTDAQGRLWIDLFGTNKLAMVDPATMKLTEFALPRSDARPRRIALTSDGRVWYGDYMGGYLGVYDPRNGKFTEYKLPSGEDSRPYAMTSDDRDRIWIMETGPQPNQLVGFDTKTNAFISTTSIPSGGGVVRHMIYHAPTREIWFGTDAGTIGRAKLP